MKDTRLRLIRRSPFQTALNERVNAWFETAGKDQRGDHRLFIKTAVIVLWWLTSYAVVMTGIGGWLGLILGALSMGLALAGLGFDVMHDGNHGAYGRSRRVNRTMGAVSDLLGSSSYFWRHKHNVLHHTYPNVVGTDDDIDVGVLGRMAPGQQHFGFHRLQHLYMWALYGLISIKWHWFDDFYQFSRGTIGPARVPRPKGGELALFIGGKVFFFGWAIVAPIVVLGAGPGLLFYLISQFTLGVVLSVTFQMAHCVEEAEFAPVTDDAVYEVDFARLQLDSTVDFARGNPMITWFMGGLNYQTIHHLFPKISHVHYPDVARIVEAVCAEHAVTYKVTPSLGGALRSHYRWLRHMGQAPLPA
jgi:linoleoyl-CoA desaturase